jgi:RNA polymerase sigma factor (sigma-70 family)
MDTNDFYANRGGGAPILPSFVRDHIAARLRDDYREAVSGEIPERFRLLVESLERALRSTGAASDAFGKGLLSSVPSLRAFALSLTHNPSQADDLVQDTLVKGWQHRGRFEPGTNLNAWLFTILRNVFYSNYRKKGREVEDSEGVHASKLASYPNQGQSLDVEDMREALKRLPPVQASALVQVAVEGMTYEQVAVREGVAVGTIKSRVSRAREKLAELLGYDETDIGGERAYKGIVEATA